MKERESSIFRANYTTNGQLTAIPLLKARILKLYAHQRSERRNNTNENGRQLDKMEMK